MPLFAPFTPFALLHSPSPLSPTEVVGTLKPSIEYALLPFVPTEVVGTLKPSIQYALLPFVPTEVVATLKPSIQYALPPSPTLVPPALAPLLFSHPPFTPLRSLHSPLHSPSPPLPPFALLHSPLPLAPTEVVGTLQPSIEYTSFPFTPFAPLCPLTPCPHRGGGDPKT